MDLKGPRVRIEGLEIKELKACVQGGGVFSAILVSKKVSRYLSSPF